MTDAQAGTEAEERARGLRVRRCRLWGYRRLAAYFALTGAPESAALIERAIAVVAARYGIPAGSLDAYPRSQAERECAEALRRGEEVLATEGGRAIARSNQVGFQRQFSPEFQLKAARWPWLGVIPASIREMVVAHCGPDFDDLRLPPAEAARWLEMWTDDLWGLPFPGPESDRQERSAG